MKSIRAFLASALLIATFAFTAAIPTGCKATLEEGGAYAPVGQAPDKAFYAVDAAYDLAYGAMDGAFKFEQQNRQLLWQISPEIKHALDKVRPQALVVARQYTAARKAYLANPTPSGLSTLQTTLSRLQQLSAAATAALPK